MPREFPKAPLFQLNLIPLVNIGGKYHLKPMYWRMSNGSSIFILWLKISWRMPWLPIAAYEMGWDAAWRQCNGLEP